MSASITVRSIQQRRAGLEVAPTVSSALSTCWRWSTVRCGIWRTSVCSVWA